MTPLIAIPIGITVATATWIVISWWDKRRRDRKPAITTVTITEQSGNFPKGTRIKRRSTGHETD
jgi:hypothetical protein